jgi:hypothetical protein
MPGVLAGLGAQCHVALVIRFSFGKGQSGFASRGGLICPATVTRSGHTQEAGGVRNRGIAFLACAKPGPNEK